MWLEEPIGQHAIFGDAVENAIGADDGRVHGAGQYQKTDHHHKSFQAQLEVRRTDDVAGKSGDQVAAVVFHAHFIGDDEDGQEADGGRQQQAVDEDDEGGALEVLHLGRFDFAVNLGQGLFAGHGQYGMSKSQEQPQNSHAPEKTEGGYVAEEAQRIFGFVKV